MNESIAAGVVIILLFVYLVILGIGIASYILQSLALHTLSKRRGIANPWLAWLPFGNYWIIGSLARDYDRQKGIHRRWDTTLLILSLVGFALFLVAYIALIVFVIVNAVNNDIYAEAYNEVFISNMFGSLLVFYVLLIVALVGMMALQALVYVCIYKIFESTVPQESLKYFLIYLLVPFAAPICLFICRNKGYQHPDPLAYLYAPVNKNYTYYRVPPEQSNTNSNAAENEIQPEANEATEQTEENND